MKLCKIAAVAAGCCLCGGLFLSAGDMSDDQKNKLNDILRDLKDKAKSSKPAKYEVALPVASAGVRGAEMKQADRFAVVWPDTGISPLTALAANIQHDAEQGEKSEKLLSEVDEFVKTFPEFSGEKLIKELKNLLEKKK